MSKPRMKPAEVDALDAIMDSLAVPMAPARYTTADKAAERWGIDRRSACARLNADKRLASAICRVPGSTHNTRCWWVK